MHNSGRPPTAPGAVADAERSVPPGPTPHPDAAVTTGTDSHLYINAANFNGGTTALTGTAEAGDTVMVSINGAAGQAASVAIDGSWSLQVTGLTDGEEISAVLTATDPAGNAARAAPSPSPSTPRRARARSRMRR